MNEMKTLGTILSLYPSINSPLSSSSHSNASKREREEEREKERKKERERERKSKRGGGVLPPIIQSLSPPTAMPSTFREVAIAS